jgi:hypothetical protein
VNGVQGIENAAASGEAREAVSLPHAGGSRARDIEAGLLRYHETVEETREADRTSDDTP